ncbi:MAG: metal-dependent hydrolase [Candidatus Hermodarchaeota archaeon]
MAEPVKHTEWALGIVFFSYAFINLGIFLDKILILGLLLEHTPFYLSLPAFVGVLIGSQIPDLLDIVIRPFQISSQTRRKLFHSFLLPIVLMILAVLIYTPSIQNYIIELLTGTNLQILIFSALSELLAFIAIGTFLHLVVDLFAGGDPVYLLGPILEKGAWTIITKEKRLKIGQKVEKSLGDYVLASPNTEDDIAWFWLMQLGGTSIVILSFVAYLIVSFLPL